MKRALCFYGNPILREKAKPVTEFDDALRVLAADMVETMHAESGIGLAGPQVGVDRRIFVMEIPEDMDEDDEGSPANPGVTYPLVVVNPEISDASPKREDMEEGCLSIPEVRGKVSRPVSITLKYQNLQGESCELRLKHLAARCAMHETDHLDGVLFVDLLSPVKRVAIKGKLKRLKENS